MLRTFRATLIMVGECFRMSLSNIRGAKVRSFLTVLGILIGVMAVITLITTVNGVTGSISDSFQSMGAGTLTVSVTGSDLKPGLSREDLLELAALPEVEETVTVSISASWRTCTSPEVAETVSFFVSVTAVISPEVEASRISSAASAGMFRSPEVDAISAVFRTAPSGRETVSTLFRLPDSRNPDFA